MALLKTLQSIGTLLLFGNLTACNDGKSWSEVHAKSMVLYKQGSYGAAIVSEKEALVIAYHDEHDDVNIAASLFSLGAFCRKNGQPNEGKAFYKQAIFVWKKTDSPQVATAMGDLAQMYIDEGNYLAAEPLLNQYLEIVEKQANNGAMVAGLEQLAVIYKATDRIYQYHMAIERMTKIRGH